MDNSELERRTSPRDSAMKARHRVHSSLLNNSKERKEEEDREEEVRQTLEEIKERRRHRYERISAILSSACLVPTRRKKIVPRLSVSERPAVCFLCGIVLTGDSDAINGHIDACLASTTPRETSKDATSTSLNSVMMSDPFETYSWAGQTRIRPTSLLEGGLASAGFQSHSKRDKEVDFDLDVEEDDAAIYGQPQFSEEHLIKSAQIFEEDKHSRHNIEMESSLSNVAEDTSHDTITSHQPVSDSEISCISSNSLLLESLKAKIVQQELLLKDTPKCMICLGPYVSPLTSIVCWHVYCENCWLKTLGAKKVCPQCVVIVAPSDLRRIYL